MTGVLKVAFSPHGTVIRHHNITDQVEVCWEDEDGNKYRIEVKYLNDTNEVAALMHQGEECWALETVILGPTREGQ